MSNAYGLNSIYFREPIPSLLGESLVKLKRRSSLLILHDKSSTRPGKSERGLQELSRVVRDDKGKTVNRPLKKTDDRSASAPYLEDKRPRGRETALTKAKIDQMDCSSVQSQFPQSK
jgi:hypothetical protein